MTIKDKIVELLIKKNLTFTEISAELQIPKKNLKVYLFTLRKESKIDVINDKKPFIYQSITPKSLLKQLYDIMSNYMEVKEDKIDDFLGKKIIIQKIKELIL